MKTLGRLQEFFFFFSRDKAALFTLLNTKKNKDVANFWRLQLLLQMNSCFYSVARVPRGPGGCSRTCERTCDVPPLSLGAAALCVAPLSPGWSGRDGVLRSRAPDTRGSGTALRRCNGHKTHVKLLSMLCVAAK